jgi:hypothetical protein
MTRKGLITIVMIAAVLVVAAGSVAAQELVFHEPFSGDGEETFEVWGTAFPFNRVEAYEGALELEGSNGFEAFGVYFKPEFDLADGPLTIQVQMTRNSEVPGSEINVWFVNQYLIDGDPWMEGDFVRVGFFSTRDEIRNAVLVQEYSPDQRGAGNQLAIAENGFPMGERFELAMTLTPETFVVAINGDTIAEGEHNLPATTGYLFIHDWNSIDVIDYVHDVKVYRE